MASPGAKWLGEKVIEDDFRLLTELTEKRDAARQAWLRHLHLLAAGALTLLAGMGAGDGTTGMAAMWLRATWAALGIAILTGGAALYAETSRHETLACNLAERLQRDLRRRNADGHGGLPVTAQKPLWIRAAETAFLTSLVAATICLVAFAVGR